MASPGPRGWAPALRGRDGGVGRPSEARDAPQPPSRPAGEHPEVRLWRRARDDTPSRKDSEALPWLVDQDDLEAVLNGLAHQSRTLDELGAITSLRPDKLAAASRRSEEAGTLKGTSMADSSA